MRFATIAFWPCLLISALVHGAALAVSLLASPVTPPRPIGVNIGVTSLASAESRAAEKVDPLTKPLKPVDPKKEIVPIAEPKKDERPPEPKTPTAKSPPVPPPKVETREQKAVMAASASINSQANRGAESDVLPRRTLTNPEPPYPPEALTKGLTGRVVLRVLVTAEGRVGAISVDTSSGHDILDRVALETVGRHWRYIPARRGDVPIAFMICEPINFELRSPK